MTRKYFGTDGIRGRVGEGAMSAEFVLRLGRAVGRVLAPDGGGMVVIGKDTRSSGYMFESALEAGLSAAGCNIRLLGPMPTPGIAYLTRTFRANAGIVISASHNPFQDNGIKFFSSGGEKLDDDFELAIEAEIERPFETVAPHALGSAKRVEDASGRYIEFCKGSIPYGLDLKGLKIVVDCAHGATYKVAPHVFDDLGAKVTTIGTAPNGTNINLDCGSTAPAALQAKVAEVGADLGIALDGDGDRVLMVDHTGEIVDGDELLFIVARHRQAQGGLKGPVVGTVMSNLGLAQALDSAGIAFRRAKVGDRYVLAMLKEAGGVLGGETSGHIVCLDRTTTGDGIVAALQVLAAMVESGQTLADLKHGMEKFPQHMINVPLATRFDLDEASSVQHAVEAAERQLGGNGRIVLRPSGTEPVVRVMVEGRDEQEVLSVAASLAEVVESAAKEAAAA
ncbi:MAG TPA: phosphoglucosamine mutase [Gammaproteobacteria bacterium]|nr:phosphoglucosamine mutase [Gammaproteobacteria bacterium]